MGAETRRLTPLVRSGPAAAAALLDEDEAARRDAIDPARSFLVQAPAGSGKTELLIQRVLALLAHVDRPERVVAITFTRKAAGEMRERVVRALAQARAGTPVESPHQAVTRKLAQAALAQDARHGWQLCDHPARLAVSTIDALSAALARAAPVGSGLGAAPRIEEDANAMYAAAAHSALAAAAPDDAAWTTLLAHRDNDGAQVVELVAAMLGKREQWLRLPWSAAPAALRAALERTLADEVEGELALARNTLAVADWAALAPLAAAAADFLEASGGAAPALVEALAALGRTKAPPPGAAAALPQWQALANWLLLKASPHLRRQVNVKLGFPPKGRGEGSADREARIESMQAWLAAHDASPAIGTALDLVRGLPPGRYDDVTWEVIAALLSVLPRAAAHLTTVFAEQGAVDFPQGSLAALAALGETDAPTDLLLRLDLRLEHLLIDEFQDTSFAQLELLARLTAGWTPGDGRTVFAVGDPMQSIYRFRGAEVRVFVDSRQRGDIAGVPVLPLTLRQNFRSQAGLVDWVNGTFPAVLGAVDDPWRGAVAFEPAVARHPLLPGLAATFDACTDVDAEAERVVAHVREALAGDGDVAILARSRGHLAAILPALRARGIAYAAVDLDHLGARPAILDLQALTHAIVQPADRLAWLAVLRAPWCGLGLADLCALVAAADAHPTRSLAALVVEASAGAGTMEAGAAPPLSADGQARFARVASIVGQALAARGHVPLSARVRGTWLALGGPATVVEPLDLAAADRFFALLSAHERAGDVPDWPGFVATLAELRAADAADAATRLRVMTMHKAKGLEFDTVVVVGAGRGARNQTPELLRWRVRPDGPLLGAVSARGGVDDPVGAYLKALAGREEDAELARLMYVACTRAKRRLHLTTPLKVGLDKASGASVWKPPATRTALARMWPQLGSTLAPPPSGPSPDDNVAATTLAATAASALLRLPRDWSPPPIASRLAVEPRTSEPGPFLPFDWAREVARHVGTVAHRMFAAIAADGLAAWSDARVGTAAALIGAELRSLGVGGDALPAAIADVQAAVRGVLADERGRWLFAPTHDDPRSEWALAGIDGGTVVHVVLDRTFVADGVRWIVDFKTGGHEGGDVEAFLDTERERYAVAMRRYARLVGALDPRPVRLGLYHPRLRGWREWAFDPDREAGVEQ